jgi:hypothetical protein
MQAGWQVTLPPASTSASALTLSMSWHLQAEQVESFRALDEAEQQLASTRHMDGDGGATPQQLHAAQVSTQACSV